MAESLRGIHDLLSLPSLSRSGPGGWQTCCPVGGKPAAFLQAGVPFGILVASRSLSAIAGVFLCF